MLPLLCLLLPASAWAGTYYVSSSSGEDTAAGTSPSAPWRTLAKAGTQALRPGDSLLLRQGDSWIVETGDALVLRGASGTRPRPPGAVKRP